MTKQQALVFAYICTVPCALCLAFGQYVPAALFILLTVVLFGIWACKDWRDNVCIIQAKQEREPAPETVAPTLSKKKPGLFVPPPLHEHNKETMQ